MTADDRSPGISGAFKLLARYVRPHARPFLAVVLLSLLDTGLSAQISLSFKYLMDDVIGKKDGRMLAIIAGALAVSMAITGLAGLRRDRLYANITGQLISGLRRRLFTHLISLSSGFYSRWQTGDILSRFSNDLAEIESAFLNGVPWGILPILDIVLSTALIFMLDWRLALVTLAAFPLSLAGPKLLSSKVSGAAYERKSREASLIGSVNENVSAHALVKAFCLAQRALTEFGARNTLLQNSSTRLGFLTLVMERSSTFSTQVLQVVVLVGGGYLTYIGAMTVGTFVAFQALFATLCGSLAYLAEYISEVVHASGGIQRVEELLAEQQEVADPPSAQAMGPFSQSIELHGVTFRYGENTILNNVNLTIRRGESVAFVGPSGSGKSTILTLIMRFYDPQGGAVLVDGRDLREVTQESWRAQTAAVFQENFLFDATLRDNIRMGRPDATEEEVEAAARQAGIHDFIVRLPKGYDTNAGAGGGHLSGGQRQRLAIARALLCGPRTLILDEATSALDSVTEAQINETIERASRDRTVLSVTHRLASAVTADRIFYLEHGSILEQGPHQELLERNGAYARLWKKQSGFISSEAGERIVAPPDRLRDIPILAGLDQNLLEELSAALVTERCSGGTELTHEGDFGGKFYILVRGTVELTRMGQRVSILEDGDHFGEAALLMNAPASTSARALSECTLLALPREKFQSLVERAPLLRFHLRESAAIAEYRSDEAAQPVVSDAVAAARKLRHDLLNEINCMIGYSEMLTEDLDDAEDLGVRLRSIHSWAREAQAAVEAVLSSGRALSAAVWSELQRSIGAQCLAVLNSAGELYEQSGTAALERIGDDLGQIVFAAARVNSVLSNQGESSEKDTPERGDLKHFVPFASSAGARILIVDDNAAGRELLGRKLDREGYRVSFAEGGQRALTMLGEGTFDLMLLDIMMPGMNGFDVLRRMKETGLADTPVIVTSALDEVHSAVRCMELGAQDFLTKPFDPVLLKARISACLERKQRARTPAGVDR